MKKENMTLKTTFLLLALLLPFSKGQLLELSDQVEKYCGTIEFS